MDFPIPPKFWWSTDNLSVSQRGEACVTVFKRRSHLGPPAEGQLGPSVNDDDDFDDGLRANSRPRGKRGFAARQVFTIMTMMVMMMFIIIIMMMLMLMKMIMFRIMNENIKAYQFDLIY